MIIAASRGALNSALVFMVDQLISAGADVTVTASGCDALRNLASTGPEETEGHAELCFKLVTAGADVNARPDGDLTALLEASRTGAKNVAYALLQAGADPNAISAGGQTALAIASEFPEIQQVLVQAGATA